MSEYSEDFVRRNAEYAKTEFPGPMPLTPSKHIAIVTCMDARFIARQALGIKLGEANVIKNAGGRAQDALRSLIISQQLLGTREIHVVHHTNCGLMNTTNDDMHKLLRDKFNTSSGDSIDFQTFKDLDQSVREDVHFLRDNELIHPESKIVGWVYQVEDGKIRKVEEV